MPALTQSQINESVEWAKANLTGAVPDEYGGFPGECLSLNRREFVHRTGQPYAPNSPNGLGTGWMQRPGTLADFFNEPEVYNPGIDYPKGSYAFNMPTNHIMIYDHREGNNAAVYEQNADPDHSPAGMKLRSGARISHIMTPKILPENPYIRSDIPDKLVQFNKNCHKWDLNRSDFNDRAAHAIGDATQGAIITVRELVHFNDNNSYYIENPGDTTGFNVLDCDDYTPPAPVEMDWNSIYKFERLPQSLAVETNKNTEVWNLQFTGGYANAKPIAPLPEGTGFTAVGKATKLDFDEHPVYYLSNESFGTADTTGAPIYWQGVNTIDLRPATPPPKPTDTHDAPQSESAGGDVIPVKIVHTVPNPDAWKTTFKTNCSGDYIAMADITVHDIEGRVADKTLAKGLQVHIAGDFTGPDNIRYYRTVKSVQDNNWRGIPEASLEEDDSIFTFKDRLIDDFNDIKNRISHKQRVVKVAAVAIEDVNWLASRLKKKGPRA